jgi:hypothetical protein
VSRLSREGILVAFAELSEELAGAERPYELIIGGGAALVLLFGGRESTRDVDAVLADRRIIKASENVALKLGLPNDWLNDAAQGYLHGLSIGATVFNSAALVVKALSVPQLLAMKLSAWRDDVDIGDARILLSSLSGAKEDVWMLVERHVLPGSELKAYYAFEDLWESQHGAS